MHSMWRLVTSIKMQLLKVDCDSYIKSGVEGDFLLVVCSSSAEVATIFSISSSNTGHVRKP